MGLDAKVYKSLWTLNEEFPGIAFQREPTTGECEFVGERPSDVPYDFGVALHHRIGDISLVAHLRDCIAALLGGESSLNSLVLYSGSHSGDTTEAEHFPVMRRELAALQSSTDAYVRGFIDQMVELLDTAEREDNPIVY